MQTKTFAYLTILSGIFYALHQGRLEAGEGLASDPMIDRLVSKYADKFNLDPEMVRAIIQIESSGDPHAVRPEPKILDASIGLMQTLLTTAQWLARDMGYDYFGYPTHNDLLNPEISVYFGCAYLHWLSTYRNQKRSERWIVMSYNGGPSADNNQTRHYWQKYQKAKKGA